MTSSTSFEPIKIKGIIESETGMTRNDGTRIYGLYKVTLQLSSAPPNEWRRLFVAAWNHPLEYTSMHRPGIAQVGGDCVILNGTTVEEIATTHKKTLLLAIDVANHEYAAYRCRQEFEERDRDLRHNAHRSHVREANRKIKFE